MLVSALTFTSSHSFLMESLISFPGIYEKELRLLLAKLPGSAGGSLALILCVVIGTMLLYSSLHLGRVRAFR